MDTQKWVSEPPRYYWTGMIRKVDNKKVYKKYYKCSNKNYSYQKYTNESPKHYESIYFEDHISWYHRYMTTKEIKKLINEYIFL